MEEMDDKEEEQGEGGSFPPEIYMLVSKLQSLQSVSRRGRRQRTEATDLSEALAKEKEKVRELELELRHAREETANRRVAAEVERRQWDLDKRRLENELQNAKQKFSAEMDACKKKAGKYMAASKRTVAELQRSNEELERLRAEADCRQTLAVLEQSLGQMQLEFAESRGLHKGVLAECRTAHCGMDALRSEWVASGRRFEQMAAEMDALRQVVAEMDKAQTALVSAKLEPRSEAPVAQSSAPLAHATDSDCADEWPQLVAELKAVDAESTRMREAFDDIQQFSKQIE